MSANYVDDENILTTILHWLSVALFPVFAWFGRTVFSIRQDLRVQETVTEKMEARQVEDRDDHRRAVREILDHIKQTNDDQNKTQSARQREMLERLTRIESKLMKNGG